MYDLINTKTISEWKKDGYIRRITPVADIIAMLKNTRSNFLDTLVSYIDFVLVQYRYRNYIQDACEFMLDVNGPYRAFLEDVHYYYFPDDEYSSEVLEIGHLIGYIESQDEFMIEQFIWRFLIALRGLKPRDPPLDYADYFEQVVSEQFVVLINKLREG
jgi:hypothetical protein